MASGAESRTLSLIVLLLLIAGAVSVIPFVLVSSGAFTSTADSPAPTDASETAPLVMDTPVAAPDPERDAANDGPKKSPPADVEATTEPSGDAGAQPPVDDNAPRTRRIPVENIALVFMAIFLLIMLAKRVDPNRWIFVLVIGIFGCLFSCGMYRGEEIDAMPFRLFAWEDIVSVAAVTGAIIIKKKRPLYDGQPIEVSLISVIIGAVFLSFGWKMALGYPWPIAASHLMGDVAVVFVPTGIIIFVLLMLLLMIAALSGNLKKGS